MRTTLAVLFAGLAVAAYCAEEKAPAVMPTEVTLTTGRVLRNVSVIRWESNRVVLKHTAGADPIAFALFKVPTPAELPAIKAASMERLKKADTEKAKAAAAGPEMVEYTGQAFITTRGAGSYKLGGMTINICQPETSSALEANMWRTTLKAPIMRVKTDADGNFSFKMQKGQEFFIFAQFSRFIGGKTGTEYYEWRISSAKIDDTKTVQLNGFNARDAIAQIEWEG